MFLEMVTGAGKNIRPCMVHTCEQDPWVEKNCETGTKSTCTNPPSLLREQVERSFTCDMSLWRLKMKNLHTSTNSSKALVIRFTHPAPTNEFQLVSTRRANTQTRRAICMGSVGGRKEEEERCYPELIGSRRC